MISIVTMSTLAWARRCMVSACHRFSESRSYSSLSARARSSLEGNRHDFPGGYRTWSRGRKAAVYNTDLVRADNTGYVFLAPPVVLSASLNKYELPQRVAPRGNSAHTKKSSKFGTAQDAAVGSVKKV